MAHTHDPGHTHTVVEERDGMSGVLMAIIAIVLVAFLVYALFFSGWVFNSNPAPANAPSVERTDTNIDVDLPNVGGGGTSGGTTGGTSGGTTGGTSGGTTGGTGGTAPQP